MALAVRSEPPRLRRRLARAGACLVLAGCTAELHGARPPGGFATINVGSTVVRQIDGQHRRGGAFDAAAFEVDPGPHRLVLVFELPARSIGLKTLPAQPGVGVCELQFEARAGHEYFLVARPLGEFSGPRWSGAWEAWVRDPAVAAEDDVIARCQGAEPAETPTPELAAPAVAVSVPTATPLPMPSARAVRVGAWRLPALAAASSADLAAAAAVIAANFDVLTLAPALDPAPLLAALGDAWSATPGDGTIVLYRRDLVRPCAPTPPAAACLQSIDTAAGAHRPLLLMLPPAEAHP
ncbi:MAG: hypothetical protein U0802_05975 [Candidatus Binatia bacterium]